MQFRERIKQVQREICDDAILDHLGEYDIDFLRRIANYAGRVSREAMEEIRQRESEEGR